MKYYKRNYLSDNVSMYLEIYSAMDKCFNENQKDENGVSYSIIVSFIMKETIGRYNPIVINEIIKEFEIKDSI